eukprot:4797099-Alexandrium_andersonii.AAC.1
MDSSQGPGRPGAQDRARPSSRTPPRPGAHRGPNLLHGGPCEKPLRDVPPGLRGRAQDSGPVGKER